MEEIYNLSFDFTADFDLDSIGSFTHRLVQIDFFSHYCLLLFCDPLINLATV